MSSGHLIKEQVIPASKQYKATNSVTDFVNHRFGGLIKRYMAKKMLPQKEPIEFPNKYKNRVDIIRDSYDGRPVYTLLPKGGMTPDKEMIFIHGGGGLMPPTSLHFETAVSLVCETGIPLNFLMYPLAPKANCAQAVSWLSNWYEDKNQASPNKSLYVIGDSAGAGLATALCNGGRKNVDGVILISPAAGLDMREKYMSGHEEHDILLSMELMDNIAAMWGSGMELTDWRINSSYVDYRGFPATMIIYGEREMFAGTIPILSERMTDAGVDLSIYKGNLHCHDWALARMFPEARKMQKIIAEYISQRGAL